MVAGVPWRARKLDLNDIHSAGERQSVCSTNSRHTGQGLQRGSGALIKSRRVSRLDGPIIRSASYRFSG
jgi:hypothetical protein